MKFKELYDILTLENAYRLYEQGFYLIYKNGTIFIEREVK